MRSLHYRLPAKSTGNETKVISPIFPGLMKLRERQNVIYGSKKEPDFKYTIYYDPKTFSDDGLDAGNDFGIGTTAI